MNEWVNEWIDEKLIMHKMLFSIDCFLTIGLNSLSENYAKMTPIAWTAIRRKVFGCDKKCA